MPVVSIIDFYQVARSALSSYMRRILLPRGRQNSRLVAVSLGIFIFLSYMTTSPVLAQDLELDRLGIRSGGCRPAQPSLGKLESKVPQEEEKPVAETAREAPQETPQVQYERRPARALLSNISNRLLNVNSWDNSTNRTAIIGRFQISGEYRDRRDGSAQVENVERLDIPVGNRMIFRTDVPFLNFNPQMSGSTSVSGLGDISARLGGQIWARPAFTAFFEGQVVFPTASDQTWEGVNTSSSRADVLHSDSRFGYRVYPGGTANILLGWGIRAERMCSITKIGLEFTTTWANNLWWTTIEPDLYVDCVQSEAIPVRQDVNYSKIKIGLDTPWGQNWWTTVEPNFSIDWTQKAKTAMNLEFEVGRRLGDHFRVWLRPAVGLWGTGVPGAYDWFTQFGIRYMF